jgi:LacI family transcriptional regulator, repressor for deo operon, udp, cdd, tsx, nupC, and nupG
LHWLIGVAVGTRGRPRRVTISDVAAGAGVATSTVSRAFSRPDLLTVETREHVLQVADQLGYRPSPIARAMTTGVTNTIALLVGDITNPYFFGLIRGAERQAAAAGYTLVLADNDSAEAEERSIARLARSVDGFILGTSRLNDEELRSVVRERAVVTVNRPVTGAAQVLVDSEPGMRQAAEHLASLGHRSVTYLAGGSALTWIDKAQWRSLRAACDDVGISADQLGRFSPTLDGGAAAADAAVFAGTSAVVAFNDMMALGVLRRLADRGVSVPGDISVMGVDDMFGADLCAPRLTTVRADLESAGRGAADLLLGALTGPARRSRRMVVPTGLVVRESTGDAPPG